MQTAPPISLRIEDFICNLENELRAKDILRRTHLASAPVHETS
jgi:hypothetical protein